MYAFSVLPLLPRVEKLAFGPSVADALFGLDDVDEWELERASTWGTLPASRDMEQNLRRAAVAIVAPRITSLDLIHGLADGPITSLGEVAEG